VNPRRAFLFAVAVPSLLVANAALAQTSAPAPSAVAPAAAPPALPASPASTPGGDVSTDARALAETLFFTGRGLMEGGRFALACQKFAESPSASSWRRTPSRASSPISRS